MHYSKGGLGNRPKESDSSGKDNKLYLQFVDFTGHYL